MSCESKFEANFQRCMYPSFFKMQDISRQLQLAAKIVQVCPWLGAWFNTYMLYMHTGSL